MHRLTQPSPLVGVELRPPRAGLSRGDSIDVWIDMYHAMERLARRDTVIFLTDNAVGQAEEENLSHLSGNLPEEVDRRRIVPFLTSKHSIDYCHLYASRAAESGFDAITVLGGDQTVGPPRCVPHASALRRSIRKLVPQLRLGGWANPHTDPAGQADFVTSKEYEIDFYLTQIVSHHRLDVVERFLEEVERLGAKAPAVFGVFFYRSARAETLSWLSRFFPVPVEKLQKDFASGMSPVEICATTIRALRGVGVERVYVSNLGLRHIDTLYGEITATADT